MRATKSGIPVIEALLEHIVGSILQGVETLLVLAGLFFGLALIVKGRAVFRDMRAAAGETRINLGLYAFDLLVSMPVVLAMLVLIERAINGLGLQILQPVDWQNVPFWIVAILAVFLGDMIAYFRHRLEHYGFLWHAHAIHHSDTRMTWTTIFRFHPVNRFVTAAIDTGVLAMLGFPAWALVLNNLTRHYYGAFIHMDLPWHYGPLGRIFVSPAMHRWHHVESGPGVGTNFATVFSVFDQAWGTFYLPGSCKVDLGVTEDLGRGVLGHLLHPLRVWRREGLGSPQPEAPEPEPTPQR